MFLDELWMGDNVCCLGTHGTVTTCILDIDLANPKCHSSYLYYLLQKGLYLTCWCQFVHKLSDQNDSKKSTRCNYIQILQA